VNPVTAPTLEGELVVLRPLRPQDADALWELVTDPEGRRLTGDHTEPDRSWVEARCAGHMPDDALALAVCLRDADELLGEVRLDGIDRVDAHATFRMSMRAGHRGRGLGSEAIGLTLDHAFAAEPGGLGLHRVDLRVLGLNQRARMLYESHGFVEEGRLREVHRDGDFWTDVIVMAVLEDDHRAAREEAAR